MQMASSTRLWYIRASAGRYVFRWDCLLDEGLAFVQVGVPSCLDDATLRSCAIFKCDVADVNKYIHADFRGVKWVSFECDQPYRENISKYIWPDCIVQLILNQSPLATLYSQNWCNDGNMVIHKRVIIDLSQLVLAVGWGSPLYAWLAMVNLITWARCRNTRNPYEARGMDNHISLPQCSQNYYTYSNMVQFRYSRCYEDARVQILRGDTERLVRYKAKAWIKHVL